MRPAGISSRGGLDMTIRYGFGKTIEMSFDAAVEMKQRLERAMKEI